MRPEPSADRHIAVQRARRSLMDNGPQATLADLEPWIGQSWQRCFADGKQPTAPIVFEPNPLAKQKRFVDEHHALIDAARPSLQNLADLVAGIGYFVLLTNAHGMVIDVAGAVDHSDPMAAAVAQVGVDLSEHSAGTSAICTALSELHPVWLHQHEHFFEATSVYSCAGAPLFDPRGACIGMLDLTGIRVREQTQLIHMVSQYALEIERSVLAQEKHALMLQVRWPGQASDSARGGLFSVDEDGLILGCDQVSRQMIPDLQSLKNVRVHLSDIFATPVDNLFDRVRNSSAVSEQPLWSGLRLLVDSSPSDPATRAKRKAALDPPLLKTVQSELIQQELVNTRGNVELAAKRLGISRATLYRKLRRHH